MSLFPGRTGAARVRRRDDDTAFDPGIECAPLEFFEPMVRRAFANQKNSIYHDTCRV